MRLILIKCNANAHEMRIAQEYIFETKVMRLASWSWGGQSHIGIVSAQGHEVTALDSSDAAAGVLSLIESMVQGDTLPMAKGTRLPLSAVQLHAPLRKPQRGIFCVGRNYHAHAAELAGSVFTSNPSEQNQWPIVFTKLAECVVGPHDEVRLPGAAASEQIDYESELAVVIGRGGKNIPASQAMAHVFGYTVVNDVTARDVQMRHSQWDLGKSFDTFCPMGPWIVTADELQHDNIRVRGWVNGELRQEGNTKDLIFDIPTLIETCSRGITLMPGDVIATGTPAGVGMGMKPPRYLKAGDVVRVEIDGVGAIENRFV
jgi:2-keto-4-pentenoate hydratase/2-oxohepta-3-ene-1,7-dioic acid hydratase in catechol pathway